MHWVKDKSGNKNCLWEDPELDLAERDLKARITNLAQ